MTTKDHHGRGCQISQRLGQFSAEFAHEFNLSVEQTADALRAAARMLDQKAAMANTQPRFDR